VEFLRYVHHCCWWCCRCGWITATVWLATVAMEERKQSWTVVTATGIKSTAVTPVMFRAANTNTNTNPPSSVSNSLLFHFNTFWQSDKTKCTELRSLEIQLHGVLKSFALTVWSPLNSIDIAIRLPAGSRGSAGIIVTHGPIFRCFAQQGRHFALIKMKFRSKEGTVGPLPAKFYLGRFRGVVNGPKPRKFVILYHQ